MTHKTKELRISRFCKWLIQRIFKDEENAKLGDFIEIYSTLAEEKGELRARLQFYGYLIRSIPVYIRDSLYMGATMLKNYFKITFRNFFKHKGYSFINILGLAVGIALFILMFLYVHYEFGYDKFNEHYDRIYRIGNHEVNRGYMAPAIGEEIDEVVPEIEKVARVAFRGNYLIQYTSSDQNQKVNSFTVRSFAWCDESIFDIFTLPFVSGDPKTALIDPWSLVLTESTAKRLFGSQNPVGETVRLQTRYDFKVTGVMKDPKQFHLDCGALTIYRQIRYMKHKDLGFAKEHIVLFNLRRGDTQQNKEVFKNKLKQHPGILEVAYSHGYPGQVHNRESFYYEGKRHGFAAFTVEPDFFKVYPLEVVAGRLFDPHRPSDEIRTCVMNEAAVREFGLENPVGTVFHREREGGSAFSAKDIEVIGVVKDFHFQSMHEEIDSAIFGWNRPWTWNASVRIAPNNIKETIRFIQDTWLSDFAYRIVMDLWMFLLPGMATLLVAFATVSYHTIKAATANPVDSLRYE
jgi:hypothetical protein